MKRKTIPEDTKINGFYINEVAQGFMGDRGEGRELLRLMGLPQSEVPFSVAVFLQNQIATWKDKDGEVATISFRLRSNQLECFGSYLGRKKSKRLFREWESYEDVDFAARLESEAIGDLCMRCIFDNF